MSVQRILVIKLSALGDFVLATTAMQAVRAAYPAAHITLLTTKPYVALGQATGLFDQIEIDPRPKFWQLGKIRALRKILNDNYDLVIDLQTNDRTGFYGRVLSDGRAKWSSNFESAAYPHTSPSQSQLHALERHREQLGLAGIAPHAHDTMAWATADLSTFSLPEAYALLVPGGSAHRPEKRWPIEHYAALAAKIMAAGITPIVLGHGAEEEGLAAAIQKHAPGALSLVGQTDFLQIIALARGARFAVGNDTGPMHLAAPTGCPSLVLFSAASDPAKCRPRGENVQVFQRDDLSALPPEEVFAALPQ